MRRKQTDPFAMVPLAAAARAAKATRSPQRLFVWLVLLYRVWQEKSRTVTLSNQALKPYRISRHTKDRALADYEAAGLVRVRRQGTKTVMVTLLLD